ncbi:MAG: hypothetical protein WAS21_17365 [Geminicoccaceae bacterium]
MHLRAPYTRFALIVTIILSSRTFIWINIICFLLLIFGISLDLTIKSVFVVFCASFIAEFILWLLIIPRKWRAREECNIIFLRGFRQEARADVPNRVLPCVGCYGRVMWLRNTVKVVDQDRLGMFSVEAVTDTGGQPTLQGDWQPVVLDLLRCADLAVVDFSSLSESLYLEVEQCLDQLTSRRIVLIAELSHSVRDNYTIICEKFLALLNVPAPIPIYPSRFAIPLRFWG